MVPKPKNTRSLRRRLRRLVVIVVASYAAVCLLVCVFQSRLIYYPSAAYVGTPADVGLPYDELRLTASDGVSIAAWLLPHDTPRARIIFCHGNAGNISHRLFTLRALHDMGLEVLIFDYRGFGKSDGSPNERGTYLDAEAAWNHVQDLDADHPLPLVIFGRSLGGAVAIELASRHEPNALVVESTFSSLADVGAVHYPLLPIRWMLRHPYDSIGKIGRIDCPKLFLHGARDELIPIAVGRALFDAARKPKRFIETPGGHVNGGFTYSHKFTARLRAFLDETLAVSVQPKGP